MFKRTAILVIGTAVLSACSGGLDGQYGKEGAGFLFKGHRVEMQVFGTTQVGTYSVEDGKVYLTIGGQTQALKLDGRNCIDGGPLYGRLCRQ